MNVRGVFVVGSLVAGTFVPALGAVSPANASVPAAGTLQAVSCVSGGFCVAVGRSDTGGEHPRIEQWDGTKWSLAATPAGPAGVLSGVSCVSAVDCTAVGGPTPGPVAEHWNGSTWSRQATPRGSDSYYDDLRAVSCSSATTCIAVGFTDTNNRGYAPLAERWNGASWKITPTPNPSGSGDTRLAGVTCVSATDCFAAGYSSPLKHDQALLLHWDGRAWSNHTLPAPSAASDTSFLNAIQCVRANNCTAVGSYGVVASENKPRGTLVEHWNGSAWTVEASANTRAEDNTLLGVSCLASGCSAVGFANGAPVIEAWNGTTWSLQASPQTHETVLFGVACVSTTNCTAVGARDITPQIEKWNGKAWGILPSP